MAGYSPARSSAEISRRGEDRVEHRRNSIVSHESLFAPEVAFGHELPCGRGVAGGHVDGRSEQQAGGKLLLERCDVHGKGIKSLGSFAVSRSMRAASADSRTERMVSHPRSPSVIQSSSPALPPSSQVQIACSKAGMGPSSSSGDKSLAPRMVAWHLNT